MTENNNATCSICGNKYHLCLSCKDSMKLHPWKIYCCSSDCYKVFQVVRGFSTGVYDEGEFKSKLKNIDLSGLDTYREHIKVLIKDALKEDVLVADTVVEDAMTEDAVAIEDVVTEKPIYSRKRNHRTNNEIKEAIEVE